MSQSPCIRHTVVGEFRIGMIHGHQVLPDAMQSIGLPEFAQMSKTENDACTAVAMHSKYAADCTFRKQGPLSFSGKADGCGHLGHGSHS